MYFVGALIFSGFLSYICATDSCYNKTDYEFYIMQNLVKDVQSRITILKESVHAAIHTQCPNTTCPNTACADGWVSYKGSCYLFENGQTRNFQEARNFCKQLGAVLLYVNDEAENNFIVGMIGHFKMIATTHWFMGFTDQANEGVWEWADVNLATNYTAWASDEPDDVTSQNCAIYLQTPPHLWHDTLCGFKYFSICKKRFL